MVEAIATAEKKRYVKGRRVGLAMIPFLNARKPSEYGRPSSDRR